MDLDEYQKAATKTDQFDAGPANVIHHLLNLTESVGGLSRFIEQELRQGEFPKHYRLERLSRKLGDILWYLSTIAKRNGISLSDVAESNLELVNDRWSSAKKYRGKRFDSSFPKMEKLPEKMKFALLDSGEKEKIRKIIICVPAGENEWVQIGDRVDDNSSTSDGYRFHDVFHLAYVAFLGWSPVIRSLLKRKRKSNLEIDRVEDGARAANIEEAVTAFIFSHAKELEFFNNQSQVDFGILKIVCRVIADLEVRHRSYDEWEKAIIYGYEAFRKIRDLGEGIVEIDAKAEDPRDKIKIIEIDASLRSEIMESDGPADAG